MVTGTVKWFSDEKGFGFITPDEAGKDLFVHHSGIEGGGLKTLAEGASVSYDTQAGDKGPKAVNVQATSSLASQERTKPRARRPGVEGVELRRTADGKGDGVLATRPFAAGETVMVGFLVGPLRANDSHATQVGPGRWALHGGLGPKVNHSCDPNCGVRLNDRQAFDFVARQPIGAGQELTFDYAMRNFTIEHFPAVCLCGAAQCRGSITGWKDLPAARKQDYGELVAPYLRQMDDETPRGLGSASAGPP